MYDSKTPQLERKRKKEEKERKRVKVSQRFSLF
jgi:hypothetical protein